MHAWDDLVAIMTEIEKEIFGSKTEEISEYRQLGYWLIQNNPLIKALKTISGIPGLLQATPALPSGKIKKLLTSGEWGKVTGPVLGWFFGPRLSAPLKADAYYSNIYLVAVYCADKYVIKTLFNAKARKTIAKEAETMLWLQDNFKIDSTGVYFPSLIEDRSDYKYPYFIQSLISGRAMNETLFPLEKKIFNTNRWLNILERILTFTWTMYEEYGIYFQTLDQAYAMLFKFQENALELENGLSGEVKKELIDLFKSAMPLLQKNRLLPCSFVHKDISTKNIVLEKNKIWLIDWGNSRVAPIIEDQEKLINMSGDNKKLVQKIDIKMKKASTGAVYSLQEQQLIRQMNLLLGFLQTFKQNTQNGVISKRTMSFYPLDQRIRAESLRCRKMLQALK